MMPLHLPAGTIASRFCPSASLRQQGSGLQVCMFGSMQWAQCRDTCDAAGDDASPGWGTWVMASVRSYEEQLFMQSVAQEFIPGGNVFLGGTDEGSEGEGPPPQRAWMRARAWIDGLHVATRIICHATTGMSAACACVCHHDPGVPEPCMQARHRGSACMHEARLCSSQTQSLCCMLVS